LLLQAKNLHEEWLGGAKTGMELLQRRAAMISTTPLGNGGEMSVMAKRVDGRTHVTLVAWVDVAGRVGRIGEIDDDDRVKAIVPARTSPVSFAEPVATVVWPAIGVKPHRRGGQTEALRAERPSCPKDVLNIMRMWELAANFLAGGSRVVMNDAVESEAANHELRSCLVCKSLVTPLLTCALCLRQYHADCVENLLMATRLRIPPCDVPMEVVPSIFRIIMRLSHVIPDEENCDSQSHSFDSHFHKSSSSSDTLERPINVTLSHHQKTFSDDLGT